MSAKVYKTECGDLLVMDREHNFVASFKQGHWTNKILFDAYQMRDSMSAVEPGEAAEIVASARKALNMVFE